MDKAPNNAPSSLMASVNEIDGVKVVGEVIHSSEVALKLVDTFELLWETPLELEPGKTVITSGDYVLDFGTERESRWRIELNPNFQDQQQISHLSVFLVLVKTFREDDVKTASFDVIIPNAADAQGQGYSKSAGVTTFSKEKPARGFEKFIVLNKLGPVADPKSTEKLQLLVSISLFHDAVIPSPEEPKKKVTSPEPASCPPPKCHAKVLQMDGCLKYENKRFQVNSERLSRYTSYFDKYIYKKETLGGSEAPNLATHFENRAVLMKILEFCHKGHTPMPAKWENVCLMLKAAVQVNIPELRDECQKEILRRLSTNNFLKVVDLAINDVLEKNEAYPAIYKYLREHIGELDKDPFYVAFYEEYKEFYEKIMLHCEQDRFDPDSFGAEETTAGDWARFYLD